MGSRFSLQCAAVIAAAALVVGCGPDTSQRQQQRQGSAQSRPGDSSVARNESGRDSSVRPPTTAANPAAPGSAAAPSAQGRLAARAEIKPLGDHTVRGLVEFQQAPQGSSGPLMIHVMLMGLDAGPHGMHVHIGTDCISPGTHLTPQNAPHGPANAAAGMRHLGDLGNITADASGIVDEMLHDSLLGSDATFVGYVIVVHEGQDDLTTQPDGSSGAPVACGVIEAAGEEILSRGPAEDRGV